MAEMKTLNGFEIVDAKAREAIEELKQEINLPDDFVLLIDCGTATTVI